MHGCMVIVQAVHIHIHIYIYIHMIYDKTRILLNPFVGLLLGCKSSYSSRGITAEAARQYTKDRKKWSALVHILVNEIVTATLCGFSVISVVFPTPTIQRRVRGRELNCRNCKKCSTTEDKAQVQRLALNKIIIMNYIFVHTFILAVILI